MLSMYLMGIEGIFADFSHFVAILALVSLTWVAVMIHKIVKRMDEIDEDHKHLKDILTSLDEKLISFDIEAHILERLYDNNNMELDKMSDEEISEYIKKILKRNNIDKSE